MEKPLLFEEETYRILGACFEVYKEKGCGFIEAVYQECLRHEFGFRTLPAIEKPIFELEYKGVKLEQTFIPDYVCFGHIIVELKALPQLEKRHHAQVLNYLRATRKPLGMLVNFGHYPQLEHQRIVAHDHWQESAPDLRA